MTTVEFSCVGSGKRSWTKTWYRPIVEDDIAFEAKVEGRLLSRGVDAYFHDNKTTGEIIANGFRTVGSFRIISNPNTKPA